MYFILFIGIALISYLVQANLNSKFKKFSRVPLSAGLTGCEVAEKMLRDHGIYNVRVISTPGYLTDHYNPTDGTVNLSPEVYNGNSVAAAAVAAHECGHAVQHAVAYGPLTLRTSLVPIVSFASNWVQWVLLAGILLVNSFPSLLLIGIILFAMTTLFSFVTLPVEIDASRRATAWLQRAGITSAYDQPMAVSALRSAAYTYVVAALGSLATLVYYVMIFLGSSNDD
ncbi:neutral zinc metallopeptidase [gut metagenome]|uniref:Neutral zinc metallopeptidase n=1 Tax=gut metagenome TaxID=749906 RepID=J9GPI6_9ZZZZ